MLRSSCWSSWEPTACSVVFAGAVRVCVVVVVVFGFGFGLDGGGASGVTEGAVVVGATTVVTGSGRRAVSAGDVLPPASANAQTWPAASAAASPTPASKRMRGDGSRVHHHEAVEPFERLVLRRGSRAARGPHEPRVPARQQVLRLARRTTTSRPRRASRSSATRTAPSFSRGRAGRCRTSRRPSTASAERRER